VAVGCTVSLPEVPAAPLQPPDLVQEVAFVEFQVSVDEPPLCIDVGEALSVAVGAGLLGVVTFTVAERAVVPPDPVQLNV
jgi:hypothetical protein